VTDYSMMNRVDNLSLGPFVSRIYWAITGATARSSADLVRVALIAAADILVLGLTIRATAADANRGDPDWRTYSLWIATAIMLSPVGWHHYLLLLTIPMVQMVASAADGRTSSRSIWMAALAYLLSAVSLRLFNRFLVPPPTEFQLLFPWLARALEETSFLALLTGYVAAYWFATDRVLRVPQRGVVYAPKEPNPRPLPTWEGEQEQKSGPLFRAVRAFLSCSPSRARSALSFLFPFPLGKGLGVRFLDFFRRARA
jgi:hypothetical protein